jgi:hypothetical protein
MQIFSAVILILGALIVLVLGLVSVLYDLLERGPYEVPVSNHEDFGWPNRLQGAALSSQTVAANLHRERQGYAGSSGWPTQSEK